jgi:hypothetical protein
MAWLIAIVLVTIAAPAGAQNNGEEPDEPQASTRLFVMPTGRTLAGSSGYVDVIGLGVAQFQAGGTDWLSIGAGTPSIIMGGGRPVWLTPKLAVVRASRLHAAAGAVHFFAPGGSGGFAYGVATAGSDAQSVTIGLIQGYGDVSGAGPAVMLGFERQRSKRTRLMVEATVFRSGGLVIAGLRRSGKKFTSDFGMAIPIAEEAPLMAFPVISFGWRF